MTGLEKALHAKNDAAANRRHCNAVRDRLTQQVEDAYAQEELEKEALSRLREQGAALDYGRHRRAKAKRERLCTAWHKATEAAGKAYGAYYRAERELREAERRARQDGETV